jgi:hypothetical protein
VSGRVAYIAALWTSPIAWNRVPLVGNVKLEIMTARMVQSPPVSTTPKRAGAVGEQLVVRWRSIGKGSNWGLSFMHGKDAAGGGTAASSPVGGSASSADGSNEFTGLFIFEFDKEGRILSHTIEHAQEGGQWEKGVGATVVGLTDWLLGGMKGSGNDTPFPAAFSRLGHNTSSLRSGLRRNSSRRRVSSV